MSSEDDYRNKREKFERIIINNGLKWIVDQVAERISLGKISTKRVRVSESFVEKVSGRSVSRRRRSAADFYSTHPYSEEEKYFLLLTGFETVIVDFVLMQKETFENFGIDGVDSIKFLSERSDGENHVSDRESIMRAENMSQKIDNLLVGDLSAI